MRTKKIHNNWFWIVVTFTKHYVRDFDLSFQNQLNLHRQWMVELKFQLCVDSSKATFLSHSCPGFFRLPRVRLWSFATGFTPHWSQGVHLLFCQTERQSKCVKSGHFQFLEHKFLLLFVRRIITFLVDEGIFHVNSLKLYNALFCISYFSRKKLMI